MKRETGKPLVVSMGRSAASGGYQISVDADRIFADRFTATGSIGVLLVKPSIEGWYAKHEVRQEDLERGRYMRGWSQNRDWDAEIQATADSATYREYRDFVTLVAAGRRMTWDQVDAVAQGRVWLGDDALRHGLVDEIGGLEQAIAEARRRAGIPAAEKIEIAEYRRPAPGLVQRVVGSAVVGAMREYASLPEPGQTLHWMDDALPIP
jgi:protease-4